MNMSSNPPTDDALTISEASHNQGINIEIRLVKFHTVFCEMLSF